MIPKQQGSDEFTDAIQELICLMFQVENKAREVRNILETHDATEARIAIHSHYEAFRKLMGQGGLTQAGKDLIRGQRRMGAAALGLEHT